MSWQRLMNPNRDDPYARYVYAGPPPHEPVSDIFVASLVDSVSHDDLMNFKPFFEREFTTFYYRDNSRQNLDICLMFHSNKTCLVYLSPRHTLVSNKLGVKSLNFQVDERTNRLDTQARGRDKLGASLCSDSVLCYVEASNGITYPIWAGMKGKLLEINSNVLENNNLIVEDLRNGWIAMIQPDAKMLDKCIGNLVKAEEYEAGPSQ